MVADETSVNDRGNEESGIDDMGSGSNGCGYQTRWCFLFNVGSTCR